MLHFDCCWSPDIPRPKSPEPSDLKNDALDAIIISDLHLGSSICQAEALIEFLEGIEQGLLSTRHLILNGDVFDSIDFRRLKKKHWKVLSLIRKLSDHITITWVSGNHDGPSEFVSHLIGIDVRKEYILQSGGSSILILHGHRFDEFIDTYPRVTFAADMLYRFLQAIDPSHRFARFAKTNSKVFLRCAEKIRNESIAYAKSQNADAVCCGHTHHAEAVTTTEVKYYNSGCWTEMPCSYLMIKDGEVTLEQFTPVQIPSTVRQTHEDIVNTVAPSFGGRSPEYQELQPYGSR